MTAPSYFDAHVRLGLFTVEDLAESCVVGMDSFARGLKAARRMIDDGETESIVKEPYASWETGIDKSISEGNEDFKRLEHEVHRQVGHHDDPDHQERLEGNLNRAFLG